MCAQSSKQKNWHYTFILYFFIIFSAIYSGYTDNWLFNHLGLWIANVFNHIFQYISLPILALSIIVTLANISPSKVVQKTWQYALLYTLGTTLIAATISCLIYLLIQPKLVKISLGEANLLPLSFQQDLHTKDNLFSFLIKHQVLIVVGSSILTGLIILFSPQSKIKEKTTYYFQCVHTFFMRIIHVIIKLMPIGLYGFITTTVIQLRAGMDVQGIGEYLLVIILANLVQGGIILPMWLKFQGIKPWKSFKGMAPALSVAFFSKSSVGTLPLTMKTAEENLGVNPKISRFVLPLCTSFNMNGCAAFIFATIIYLMQNHGIEISFFTLALWVLISSLTAIGNAGVPMGCFFLSASLLVNMNVPITLLGIILPFYALIDMLETGLNVWSDSCVARVVHEKVGKYYQGNEEVEEEATDLASVSQVTTNN